jgi:subfamily B ATP-binding cassette protein HlyB/CyaB
VPTGPFDNLTVGELLQQVAILGFDHEVFDPAVLADEAHPLTGAHHLALLKPSHSDETTQAVLVLAREGADVVYVEPGSIIPTREPLTNFRARIAEQGLWKLTIKEGLPQQEQEKFGWTWFLTALARRKKVIRDVLVTSLLIQVVALALPLATQAIVDKVIAHQATSTLTVLGVGIALFALFSAGMSWLRQTMLLRLANVVDGELARQVLVHLFRLPLRYFEERSTGVLINRIHGVEQVRQFAAGAFLLAALEMPFMFVFLTLMISYSLPLSMVVLGFLVVMVGGSFAVGPVLRARSQKQFLLGAKLQGFLTEQVAAHETVKSLQLERQVDLRFCELNQGYLDATLSTRELGNVYGTLMQLLEQLMNAAVLCFGAWLAMTSPGFTIGMLVAFQMFSQRVAQPLLKLSGMWQELQQVRIAVAQLGDVMNTTPERYLTAATSEGAGRGALTLEGLGFRHAPNRKPLYQGLNVQVKPGQVVLITGPSGSGKSTLAKILLGMYPDYEGTVRLDGRDARTMGVNELRSTFGVVPQETVLFAGTIVANLMAASPKATFEQAVIACKMAGVHEVIENLPQGYQTEIGERGVGLSGGQKQRLAVARALLKRPRVLIFDEATSGLDDMAAEHIGETVNQLRGKTTVLFVAHKVPKCLKFDEEVSLAQAGPN